MSVKACLLCGKPLSRIWSGNSEDFCTREHRNQYRLRRGMDRLLESTRVSNVMRRRELPMALAQPISYGGAPRMADSQEIRIIGKSLTPAMPASPPRLSAGMAREGEWASNRPVPAANAEPREYRMLRQGPLRQVPPSWRSRVASPGSAAGGPVTKPAPLAPSATKGRALRVSMGFGFRLPAIAKHSYPSREVAPATLVWNDATQHSQRKEPIPERHVFGVAVSIRPPRQLTIGSRRIAVHFKWPGARTISVAAPPGGRSIRESAAPLGRNELPPVQAAVRLSGPTAGLSANFARAPQMPAAIPAGFRSATVPFDSQYSHVQEYQ